MVAGHLQEKKGYFYMVLSYPDAAGKRKTKWLPTGLPVKGNKKKAEKMLMETRQTFVPECKPIQEDMLFSDFLLQWLEIAKPTIALTTYSSYSGMAKSVIIPYFKERKITLSEIKATDIQAFYMKQLKRVKANTVIHYHSVIHRALKYAVKIDLISVNPADKELRVIVSIQAGYIGHLIIFNCHVMTALPLIINWHLIIFPLELAVIITCFTFQNPFCSIRKNNYKIKIRNHKGIHGMAVHILIFVYFKPSFS